MSRILYWVANWNLARAQAVRLLGGSVGDMLDCTHANLSSSAVRSLLGHVHAIAGYDTGSPDIRWTPEDWASLPAQLARLHIDQSDLDLPMLSEIKEAEDIEAGAKRIPMAVEVARQRHARGLDALLYCSQATLAELELAVEHAGLPRGQIVAYQWASRQEFDLSVVLLSELPSPIPSAGAGTFRALVEQTAAGAWSVRGEPGHVELSGRNAWDEVKVGLNRHTGRWRAEPLPLEP